MPQDSRKLNAPRNSPYLLASSPPLSRLILVIDNTAPPRIAPLWRRRALPNSPKYGVKSGPPASARRSYRCRISRPQRTARIQVLGLHVQTEARRHPGNSAGDARGTAAVGTGDHTYQSEHRMNRLSHPRPRRRKQRQPRHRWHNFSLRASFWHRSAQRQNWPLREQKRTSASRPCSGRRRTATPCWQCPIRFISRRY
jgi:hypothetical protein